MASAKKCNNCGEFFNIKSKRLWFRVSPIWVTALATVVIAIATAYGAKKVSDMLDEARIKAVENHLTWIEVTPINFTTKGEKDPNDASSTFWYLSMQAQNLGKETAFTHLKNWSFESNTRGKITKEDYKQGEREFSLPSGDKIEWSASFVMNSDYHIRKLINGEDTLTIKFQFTSVDMSSREECTYKATWGYTKGKFLLVKDSRQYRAKDKHSQGKEGFGKKNFRNE